MEEEEDAERSSSSANMAKSAALSTVSAVLSGSSSTELDVDASFTCDE